MQDVGTIGLKFAEHGLVGLVILALFLTIYFILKPIMSNYMDSIKQITEANLNYAKSISLMAQENEKSSALKVALIREVDSKIEKLSVKMDSHKHEIISKIKNQ